MAGFSNEKQGEQSKKAAQQQPRTVNYHGRTPGDFQKHAARKSVEQQLTEVNPLSRQDAREHIEARALLTSQYISQAMADGTYHGLVMAHLNSSEEARLEARQELFGAIAGGFNAEAVATENFSSILASSPSSLLLTGGS